MGERGEMGKRRKGEKGKREKVDTWPELKCIRNVISPSSVAPFCPIPPFTLGL
jgi:hypothetical protein